MRKIWYNRGIEQRTRMLSHTQKGFDFDGIKSSHRVHKERNLSLSKVCKEYADS